MCQRVRSRPGKDGQTGAPRTCGKGDRHREEGAFWGRPAFVLQLRSPSLRLPSAHDQPVTKQVLLVQRAKPTGRLAAAEGGSCVRIGSLWLGRLAASLGTGDQGQRCPYRVKLGDSPL